MFRSVYSKALWEQRRSFLWWALGVAALSLVTILFYPSVREVPGLEQVLQDSDSAFLRAFVGEFTDLRSPEGYLNSQVFFMMFPLLFIIFAAVLGSGVIAGEEERGSLDLLLSTPLTRWGVLWRKACALATAVCLLGLAFWLAAALGIAAVDMDVSLLRLGQATLSGVLLALCFGFLALATGAVTGRRGLSAGVVAGLGAAMYLLNALAPLVEPLEPFRKLSLFYYYIGADPLTRGLTWGHAGVMAGVAVGLLAAGAVVFLRRDLGV